jgi:hypothetical protein
MGHGKVSLETVLKNRGNDLSPKVHKCILLFTILTLFYIVNIHSGASFVLKFLHKRELHIIMINGATCKLEL